MNQRPLTAIVVASVLIVPIISAVMSAYHAWKFSEASVGIRYYDKGQYEKAIPRLYALREMMPESPGINSYLGYSLSRERLYPQAIKVYQRLIDAGAADYEDYYNIGICFRSMGQRKAALAAWHKAEGEVKTAKKKEIAYNLPGSSERLRHIKMVATEIQTEIRK